MQFDGKSVVVAGVLWALPLCVWGQVKVELTNEVGAKGPCLGFGIGMAIVGKCVSRAEAQGFVRVDEVGVDGLTIGTEGAEDGVITAVAPGSAAAAAGLAKGDKIVSVDGKEARWTPAMEVQRQSFGEKGQKVAMTLKPVGDGAVREVSLMRGAAPMPAGAPSGSMLLPLMVLVDWRGRFVPCTAGGVMTPAVNAICAKEYAKYGYIRAKELGANGITVDPARMDAAAIGAVDAESEAAKAGVRAGETIVAVEGKPLSGSAGELAKMYLFGRGEAKRVLVVERARRQVTAELVLRKAAAAKEGGTPENATH